MIVVGLAGRKGSGKTTAAALLVKEYGFVRIPFAGPLKAMLRALGLEDVHLDGSLKEKPCALLGGRTPRHAMQTIGTEWGRNLIHPDLWVMAWTAAVRNLSWSTPGVVADDLRFVNEAMAVRRMRGIVLRITRPDAADDGDAHESETTLDRLAFDGQVVNGGTPDELLATVRNEIL